jgi:hypothetical protein
MSSVPDDGVLFATSFRYASRRFLRSEMKLLPDRLELSGWGWSGRHRRTLPLETVKAVQWWAGEGAANLGLILEDGARIELYVSAAGLWKHRIQAQAAHLKPPHMKGEKYAGQEEKTTETPPKVAAGEKGNAGVAMCLPPEVRVSPPRADDHTPRGAHTPRKKRAPSDGGAGGKKGLVESYAVAGGGRRPPERAWPVEEAVLLALCGALCGASDPAALKVFAQARATRVRDLLEPFREPTKASSESRKPLPGDLVERLVEHVRPAAFQQHVAYWQRRFAERWQRTGDGASRSSRGELGDGARPALEGVEMCACGERLILLSRGERDALPALSALALEGSTVAAALLPPAGSAGWPGRLPRYARPQRLAGVLAERGARFLVALDPHAPLGEEVAALLMPTGETTGETVPERHRCWAAQVQGAALDHAAEWPALSMAAVIEASGSRRCYVGNADADAASVLRRTRTLPRYTSGEGDCWAVRIAPSASSARHSAQNLAYLRNAATALLANETAFRAPVAKKQQRAGWDEAYLLSVLGQSISQTASPAGARPTGHLAAPLHD